MKAEYQEGLPSEPPSLKQKAVLHRLTRSFAISADARRLSVGFRL
jgi:hypothetical protein